MTLRNHALHITMVVSVFLLFLVSASGLISIHLHSGGGISITSQFFLATGEFSMPGVIRSGEFILLFVTGLGMGVTLPLLSPVRASLLTVCAMLPPIYLDYSSAGATTLLPMEFSLLTILVVFVSNVLITYFLETQAKHRLIGIFGQYIPPEVVAEISRQPKLVTLDGESRELTVFFCDIQNFTGVAEQLNPKQLALLLNEYFTSMTEILYRYGATIDKYIGDSIMAFWGAPLPQKDHAQRAVLASLEMQNEIKILARRFVKRGWPGPSMGIGINTGIMNVGNMGSKYRIAYTVVGDAVNLGSRLETLTRTYHVPTVVSNQTRTKCKGIVFRQLDVVRVRGKHNQTRIFQPLGKMGEFDEPRRLQLKQHHLALQAYLDGDTESALGMFRELAATDATDQYYTAMIRRIETKHAG